MCTITASTEPTNGEGMLLVSLSATKQETKRHHDICCQRQDSRSTTWTGTSRACIVGMLLSAHAVRGVRDAAILSLATTTAENHRDLSTFIFISTLGNVGNLKAHL